MWRFLIPSKAKMVLLVLVLGYMFILSPSQSAAQGIAIDPPSWDFGNVLLGTSESVVFEIEAIESSETYVFFTCLDEDGQMPVDQDLHETSFFSITSAPTHPFIIRGYTSVDLEITFAPTGVGFYDASLVIVSDARQGDVFVPLQGNCVIPEPSSMFLACIGLAGLAGLKRKFGSR